MSGLVALHKTEDEPVVLENMPPYPDIDLGDLRKTMRLDGTITATRLRHMTASAIISVNADLEAWRIKNGIAEFSPDHIQHYKDAVYNETAARLTELYRSYDTTGEGHKAADAMKETIDDLWRNARWAVRDIMGEPHITVELI